MEFSRVLRFSHYWSNYLVVRWQLLLTLLVLWWAGYWLKDNYGQDDSNLWIVMNQFLILVRWTVIGLFLLAFTTTLMCWLLFVYLASNRHIELQLLLGDGHKAEAGFIPLTITLKGVLIRPFLGSVRARLIFADKKITDNIILDLNHWKSQSIQRSSISGTGKILLHDRGIYDVEMVNVQFCDMFNLVAFPYPMAAITQLYTLPKEKKENDVKANPNTTEEQTHRIDLPKRVEGEYLNYKEFESGDNVRRIVWKIYAKSGELVVRIPETLDPYASHLYFYASFYNGLHPGKGLFDGELLNVYKDKIRNLFEALKKNGFEVRIPQDQEVPRLPGVNEKHNELFQITAAQWQHAISPSDFIKGNRAAFVCLSALIPADEVEKLVSYIPLNIPIVVIQLSDGIPSPFRMKITDLVFKPEKRPEDVLRNPWMVAPLRLQLLKNEQLIKKILDNRGTGWLVKAIE